MLEKEYLLGNVLFLCFRFYVLERTENKIIRFVLKNGTD